MTLSMQAVQRPIPTMPPWLQPESRSLVARKWRHLFWARSSGQDLRGLFNRWAHWSKFHHASRLLQTYCHNKRRERFRNITMLAARAAERHDSKALYVAIRTLTPKQTRRSIRFRGPHGQLMDRVGLPTPSFSGHLWHWQT